MSDSNLRVYFHVVVEDGQTISRFGHPYKPTETCVTGYTDSNPTTLSIPFGNTQTLWTWNAQNPTFELFWAKLRSGTYGVLHFLVAEPTSATNTTPKLDSVQKWRWRHMDFNQVSPVVVNSDEAYLYDLTGGNTSANLYKDIANSVLTGYDQTDVGATLAGSYPFLWDNEKAGRIYKIMCTNPSLTTSIVLDYGMVR